MDNALKTGFRSRAPSLTSRIRWGAFAMMMAVILVFGCAWLALRLIEIPAHYARENQTAVGLIGEALSGDIGSEIRTLGQISHNSLVWSSLLSPAGREMQLASRFDARKNDPAASPMLLLDHRGKRVLGELPAFIKTEQIATTASAAIADKLPKIVVGNEAGQPFLLAVFPVIYPDTQDVVGALAHFVDVSSLFQQRVAGVGRGIRVDLLHQSRVIASHCVDNGGGRYFPVQFDLAAGKWIEGGPLQLQLYGTNNPWQMPILRHLLLTMLLAVPAGLLVWVISGLVARRMMVRLDRLALDCAHISAGLKTTVAEDPIDDEIGVLSRTLRRALNAYADINAHLEARIEEKTRKLSESETLLRTVIDESPAMIALKDAQGRFLFGNQVLAKLYGTTPSQLVGRLDSDFYPDREQVAWGAECDQAVLQDGQAQISQKSMTDRKTGEIRHFQTIRKPITGPGGEPRLLMIAHDVTELRRMHQTVAERERQYAYAMAATGEGLWDWDINRDVITHNARWAELFGIDPAQQGHAIKDFQVRLYPQDRERWQVALQRALAGTGRYRCEFRILREDGALGWIQDRGHVVERDEAGQPLRMIGSVVDITERKQAEARLRQAASVFTNTQEGILIVDAQKRIVDVNPAFTRITGFEPVDVRGKTPRILGEGLQSDAFYDEMEHLLDASGSWQGEMLNRRKGGEAFPVRLSIDVVHDDDGEIVQYVVVFSDISEIKQHQAELDRVAHYDPLTGVPNRRLLDDRLAQAIAHAKRSGKGLAICYMDLDGFKQVNDCYGHAAGDSVLVEIATRLRRTLRGEDTLARLGGDEFVMLFGDIADSGEIRKALDRVLAEINGPVRVEGGIARVSASIGYTLYPADASDADLLLRHADQAMYLAKEAGKNQYRCFAL